VYDYPESEFYGFVISNGKYLLSSNSVSLSFGSKEIFVIRKIISLTNRVGLQRTSDIFKKEGGLFFIEFKGVNKLLNVDEILLKVSKGKIDEKKSFLRGVFLGCGILSSPPSYHLEFRFEHEKEMNFLSNMFKNMNIKHLKTNNHIYIKGRENIKKFLHFVGGIETYLFFEEDAVEREVSNTTNRKANFEFANLERQTAATTRQLKFLKDIKDGGALDKMRNDLKEIAIMRLTYPYLSLSELAEKSNGRYSKQSIYYRLRKIMEAYEK